MSSGEKISWLHVVNGGRILVTFNNQETRLIDIEHHLGVEGFRRSFPSHDAFLTMQIERSGGIIWANGLVLSGN